MKKGGCNSSSPDDATGFGVTKDDFNMIIFRTGTDNDLETFSPNFLLCLRSFQPLLLTHHFPMQSNALLVDQYCIGSLQPLSLDNHEKENIPITNYKTKCVRGRLVDGMCNM